MKNILVTGVSGFLGWNIVKIRPKGWNILGIYHKNIPKKTRDSYYKADLNKVQSLFKLLDKKRIDTIIHLAAVSKLQDCAKDPDYSYRINVVLTALLAEYAKERGIHFVFISTDQVFDGQKGMYSYEDNPAPLNLYGKQKYEAERRVLNIHPTACVIRLPLLFGYSPRHNNFLWEWATNLEEGKRVKAFEDEYRTPLAVDDAARGIILLVHHRFSGIWHLGGKERLSRYEMALQLANTLDYKEKLIKPSLQSDLKNTPIRPADVSLINTKSYTAGFDPKLYQEALQELSPKLKKKIRKYL